MALYCTGICHVKSTGDITRFWQHGQKLKGIKEIYKSLYLQSNLIVNYTDISTLQYFKNVEDIYFWKFLS